ncbi:protein FAM3D isoform X1 [Xenopus laevis]|uniref:Protein FAM3D isoform X1 n=1 Tax=Xenopus laevis TaxID=8355 RepID=A0A8J1MZG5_XENLA|nr:protein FAM3D isoform X1 [Xenopus laevis]
MRCTVTVRVALVLLTLFTTWYFAGELYPNKVDMKSLRRIFDNKEEEAPTEEKVKFSCGNDKPCPDGYFAFRIISGAANVVGPSFCFDNIIIMSSVRNNIGRGLNIALINASNGTLIKTGSFDMYFTDVKLLLEFLKPVQDGTLVLVASYDDPGTNLNEEARALFTSFGSSYAKKVHFRDAWIFVGGKGINTESPFEQYLQNNKETNKYDGWPEVLEMEGCIPRKTK